MKKSDLEKIVDKRCRHLQEEQAPLGENVEANHNFRVELKKLRALLRLLRHDGEKSPALHLPKSLHHLYSAVGDVRSYQLQKTFVNRACTELGCPVPAGYMAMLQRHEQEAIMRAKEKARAVSVTKLREQWVTALPEEWSRKNAEAFLQKKKTQLAAYLAASLLTDDALHDIRKLLKNILYVWPWIEGVLAGAFPPDFFSKETCQRLAEKLGSFQDCCVALSLFRPALLVGLSPEEQERLAVIREKCSLQKAAEKEAIIGSLLLLKNEVKANMRVQTTLPVSAAQQVGLNKE